MSAAHAQELSEQRSNGRVVNVRQVFAPDFDDTVLVVQP
jgi:hypothetical protein